MKVWFNNSEGGAWWTATVITKPLAGTFPTYKVVYDNKDNKVDVFDPLRKDNKWEKIEEEQ